MKAIILAAGMGTRLRPLTNDTPKALVKVNGTPMMERQIEFLLDKGITEIFVVTGYLHEKFDYLVEKYGVEIIHNDKYAEYNNIYTMYLVKELLPDAYILEGDVFLNHNVIIPNPETSLYFTSRKRDFHNEWVLETDENDKVYGISVRDGDNDYIMSGISYWNKEDGEFIVRKLTEAVEGGDFSELYWDDVVRENISEVKVYVNRMDSDDTFEIDSVEDLKKVEKVLVLE
jgi:CTP:phosphocholine cytidylyltransferase-like protein